MQNTIIRSQKTLCCWCDEEATTIIDNGDPACSRHAIQYGTRKTRRCLSFLIDAMHNEEDEQHDRIVERLKKRNLVCG